MLALYTTAAVVLMVTDHHGQYLRELRGQLSVLTYPLLKAVELPGRAGRWLGQQFGDRAALTQYNADLEERWLLVQARISKIDALEEENRRLRNLLESSPRLGDKVLVAELLDVDLDPYSHKVVLNRGSNDGVYLGQPVTDANGVVGQIELVSAISANAVLISDPNHAIPVTLNRTGMRTIAYGTGQLDRLELRDVPASADIQMDDLIVSSGLASRFPVGFPVGVVTDIVNEPGAPFRTVTLSPLAQLDRARQVLLVWPGDLGPPAPTALASGETP